MADEVVFPAQVPRRGRPPSRILDRVSPERPGSEPIVEDVSRAPPAVSKEGWRNRYGRLIIPPMRD